MAAARDALSPIGMDGFDRIELRDGDSVIGTIQRDEADAILASCLMGIEEAKDIIPDIDTATA